MLLDWLRLWPECVRLNLQKARHARRVRVASRRNASATSPLPPAPCQSASDSGRAGQTRCEACLRFDRASRYRRVCPALRVRPEGAFCSLDSADIRPDWTRAFLFFFLPPIVALSLAILGSWALLRFGGGLKELTVAEVAWPANWSRVAEHRRKHFYDLAFQAIRSGEVARASVALVSAVRSGVGGPEENIALARLATLGGFHSLADEIHGKNLAAHPDRTVKLAIAWMDDLLISNRPGQLARLALAQLARPDAPRELWLRAFFEAISRPGVADALLADESLVPLPHPGLRFALAARAALNRKDTIAASDALLAFEGNLPGMAARRFIVQAWLDANDPTRARAAAISRAHPAPPGEIACLAHAVLRADGRAEDARAVLRPLFAEPSLHPLVLGALIRHSDRELLREFLASIPASTPTAPEFWGGVWFAASLAGAADSRQLAEARLAALGQALPPGLLGHDARLTLKIGDAEPPPASVDASPASRASMGLVIGLVPLDREALFALRGAP